MLRHRFDPCDPGQSLCLYLHRKQSALEFNKSSKHNANMSQRNGNYSEAKLITNFHLEMMHLILGIHFIINRIVKGLTRKFHYLLCDHCK